MDEKNTNIIRASAVTHFLFGGFLIIDALYLHALTFDYPKFGIAWLDPYILHGFYGVVLIIVGLGLLQITGDVEIA